MAVVQISRIQIRRGKINSGTGLPQLSSGEMAWAIDSQELYIGNGAVSEGSPGVGNTKILTINDLTSQGNILNLIQHIYKANDTTMTTGIDANDPVARLIQDKLDDSVNLLDFVTDADILADDYTASLQRAIDQLFLNPTTKSSADTIYGKQSRVTLVLPAGVFKTSDTIYIPSFASIVGAGLDKTFIEYNPTMPSDRPAIQFINDNSTIGNPAAISSTTGNNQARNIYINGLTIQTPTAINTGMQLDCVRDSIFENIKFDGYWTTGNNSLCTGIQMNVFGAVVCENNIFRNIKFIRLVYAVFAKQNILNNIFEDCSVGGLDTPCRQGFVLGLYPDPVTIIGSVTVSGTFAGKTIGTYTIPASVISAPQEPGGFKPTLSITFSTATAATVTVIDGGYGYTSVPTITGAALQALGGGTGTVVLVSQLAVYPGPRNTIISNTRFLNVKQQAVYVNTGYGNSTRNCTYTNVGNDGAGNTGAIYPHIYFNSYGNTSIGDKSDRPDDLGTDNELFMYKPELGGHGTYTPDLYKTIPIGYQTADFPAFRLPCSSDYAGTPNGSIIYTITYFYKSTTYGFTRRGTMTISADITNAEIQLSDEFDVTNGISEANQIKLDFSVKYINQVGNIYTGTLGEIPASIGIYYTNNYSADTGPFTYSYTSSS